MTKNNLPKGLRRFIRGEKAKIRKTLHNPQELNAAFRGLYEKLKIPYHKGV